MENDTKDISDITYKSELPSTNFYNWAGRR